MNALDVEFLEQFHEYSGGHLASRSTEIESARIEGDDLVLHVRRDDSLYRIVVLDHRNWGNFESVTLFDDPAELAGYIIFYLDEEIETGLLDRAVIRDGVGEISLTDGD